MTLIPRPLTTPDCYDLGKRMRQADLDDLLAHQGDPQQALLWAVEAPGEAYGIWDEDQLIGAGGWTRSGSVWSLWADLSPAQARAVLRQAASWARIIAIRARRPLYNVFRADNRVTDRWLELTRCVDIDRRNVIVWEGQSFVPFYLKSLERLPYV